MPHQFEFCCFCQNHCRRVFKLASDTQNTHTHAHGETSIIATQFFLLFFFVKLVDDDDSVYKFHPFINCSIFLIE